MENRSEGCGTIAAIAVVTILLLLLMVGGAGMFLVFRWQQTAMRAARAEAEARMQAELARAEAETAAGLRAAAEVNAASPADDDSLKNAVEVVLRQQEKAWNAGDLDAFMDHYWRSDMLTFSSGGKTTRGWDAALARYRERYPDTAAMGQLTLSDLEITPLGDSAALVLGRWSLARDADPVGGNFSLTLRKFDDRWLIVHDHTSKSE